MERIKVAKHTKEIRTLKKMGAEIEILSEDPFKIKVDNIKLIHNLGIYIILDPSGEERIYPEKEWGCEVCETDFKKFVLRF